MPVIDRPGSKLKLKTYNKKQLDLLASTTYIDPFKLVAEDLERTKDYAINNILQTEYKDLESASQYNLLLKGKNFRSAILFLLARNILQEDFTKYHDQVMCLAACIEIAHNASLL